MHDKGESTSFTLHSSEELVSELSLSEIKSELKKRGFSAKGKKAVLTELSKKSSSRMFNLRYQLVHKATLPMPKRSHAKSRIPTAKFVVPN